MSKQLYEEALADARQIKQVAEDNAKRAILEVVTPRIRNLIERQILNEDGDDEDQGDNDKENILVDDFVLAEPGDDAQPSIAPPSTPDVQGKVTIDVGSIVKPQVGIASGASAAPAPPAVPQPPALTLPSSTVGQNAVVEPIVAPVDAAVETPSPEVDEFELNLESVDALKVIARAAKPGLIKTLHSVTKRMGESIDRFNGAGKLISGTSGYRSQILEMISRVENMYECVQESVTDPVEKKKLENQLESYYKNLMKLRETKMKNQLNETDVTLKLTGLPDDVDLDSVGVDLVSDDGEEVTPDDGSEDVSDDDELDFDAEGGESDASDEAPMDEMDDDTMVEIDESMLRREIAKMKKLNETAGKDEHKPWSADAGVDSKEAHSFGGGREEEEAFEDGSVTTGGAEPLGEGDELEISSIGESDYDTTEEVYDAPGAGAQSVKAEARLAFEKRLQKRLTERLMQLKKLYAAATVKKNAAKVREAKAAWHWNVKRLTESRTRVQRLNKLVESAKRNRASLNGSQRRSAEARTVAKNLRERLNQVNLNNAKLLHTNKLLQNESLTARQKQQIVERLDEAMTVREVKLVYGSLIKTLAGDRKPLAEGAERRVIGSGSRPIRSAGSANLNESNEAARWARLAGITK